MQAFAYQVEIFKIMTMNHGRDHHHHHNDDNDDNGNDDNDDWNIFISVILSFFNKTSVGYPCEELVQCFAWGAGEY